MEKALYDSGSRYIYSFYHVTCGIKNVYADQTRYPTIDKISEINADYILLSSEPYPFTQKDIEEIKKSNPNSKVMLVDGEIFSWYGSRMLKAEEYFGEIVEM